MTRDRSYKLLLWISDAIARGIIDGSRVEKHSLDCNVTAVWLISNYDRIPSDLRPAKEQMREFAAFFSTYLTTSFDVIQRPGTRGRGSIPRGGCHCVLCVRLVNLPHLQTKKVHSRDKRAADLLMVDAIIRLASQQRRNVDIQLANQLVNDSRTRRAAAYVAYGDSLIERLEGNSDGPAVLALWRIIAWKSRGSMRRGFRLAVDDFRDAEQTLIAAIQFGI